MSSIIGLGFKRGSNRRRLLRVDWEIQRLLSKSGALGSYPRGRLVVKKVKAKGRVYKYHHLQWREGEKVLSRHVPEKEIPELQKKIEQREAYRSNCLKLESVLNTWLP